MTDVPQLTPDEADERYAEGALLLDVREQDEWDAGHAPMAGHVPLAQVPDAAGELEKDRPIVVVCRAGGRSQQAAEFLRAQGFDAMNLAGGMQAWAEAGKAVVTDGGDAGTVI